MPKYICITKSLVIKQYVKGGPSWPPMTNRVNKCPNNRKKYANLGKSADSPTNLLNATKLRLALGQLLGSAENQFSSCTERLL